MGPFQDHKCPQRTAEAEKGNNKCRGKLSGKNQNEKILLPIKIRIPNWHMRLRFQSQHLNGKNIPF